MLIWKAKGYNAFYDKILIVLKQDRSQLRLSLREDQAEVIHVITPFSMKLCQVEGTTK